MQVEAYGKGAPRFRLATGNLKTLLVPICSLAENHRIVAKVDELMALCDQLESQTEASIQVKWQAMIEESNSTTNTFSKFSNMRFWE